MWHSCRRKLCWALRVAILQIMWTSILCGAVWGWLLVQQGHVCSISCRELSQAPLAEFLGASIRGLEFENSRLREEVARLHKTHGYGTMGETLLPRAKTDLRAGITLALHGDIGRLSAMLHSREQWTGQQQEASVALAILVRNSREMVTAERVLRPLESRRLRWCVYAPPRQDKDEPRPGDALWPYPANIMRNRALQLVETTQVLLLDADFIPSTSMRSIARLGAPDLQPGQLLILPPFQLSADSSGRNKEVAWDRVLQSGLLLNKSAVIDCFDSAAAYLRPPSSPTHETAKAACGGSNGLLVAPFPRYLAANINYTRWWTALDPYPAPNIADTEPYFVAYTRELLAFDERFVGYGARLSTCHHTCQAPRPPLQTTTTTMS